MYQLHLPSDGRPHVPFVYFNNGMGGEDAFRVVVSLRKLTPDETQKWCERIVQHTGSENALGRRDRDSTCPDYPNGDYSMVNLEYMRFCIVFHGNQRDVVCMDTLCDVVDASEKQMLAASVKTQNLVPCDVRVGNGPKSVVPTAPDAAERWRELCYNTRSHGRVRVRLARYVNPDVRNGIVILPQKRVTRGNAWGAAVRAVQPTRFELRRFLRLPPALPVGFVSCEAVNESDYFVERQGTFVGDATPRTMLIPKGGRGNHYKIEL